MNTFFIQILTTIPDTGSEGANRFLEGLDYFFSSVAIPLLLVVASLALTVAAIYNAIQMGLQTNADEKKRFKSNLIWLIPSAFIACTSTVIIQLIFDIFGGLTNF